MTVRALLVVIDDEKPLGPQLAGARLWGIPWKILAELGDGSSIRNLQYLVAASQICEGQSVQWKITMPPQDGDGSEAGM